MKKLTRIIQLSLALLAVFAISTSMNEAAAQSLVYGEEYRVQNRWTAHSSFLEITGATNCQGNLYCVSSHKTRNSTSPAAKWIIESASGKKAGEPVVAGDLIILRSTYNGNGGYLGTRGYGKDFKCAGDLCVSTYEKMDKIGSTTWKVTGDVKVNGGIELAGQWNYASAGFLHIAGYDAAGNYNVATSKEIHKENKTWYMIK